jgi:ferredoxin--NADP+ reductase
MNDVTLAAPAPAAAASGGLKASGAFYVETVTWVQHWTDSLFSFRTTRDPGLRFSSGQFVMVGLQKEDGKPLVRAYSIASPAWHEELEFYSIKVPDGRDAGAGRSQARQAALHAGNRHGACALAVAGPRPGRL